MITPELLRETGYFLMEAFLLICAMFLILFGIFGLIKFFMFMRKNLS